MKKITPRVFQLGGAFGSGVFGTNVFLLIDKNLTLVDTGFRGRAAKILTEIIQLGYSPSDIENIIITHHHVDHIGSLAELKEATQARIMAHPADVPYIEGQLPQPGPSIPERLKRHLSPLLQLWTTSPVKVDIQINHGEELAILGGIRVLHTPGHTPGSICLLLPQERLVLVGDIMANRFRLSLPSREYTVDLAQEIQSIQAVADLDFDTICFGHGNEITRNAHDAIINFAGKIKDKYGANLDKND